MFLVWVIIIFLHVKRVCPVHSLDFTLRPNALIVICLKFWTSWCQPPKKIDTDSKLGVVKEVLLLSILLLKIVNVALIVVYGCDLLREQIKGKISEE